MARAELLIVPDEGAGEVIRSALVEEGIPVEVERARLDHPFRPQVLAEPWRILVPAEQLTAARRVLERLSHALAGEVEAQAAAHRPEPEPEPDPEPGRPPARRPRRP
jgi:hypothetical protein